MSHHLSVKVYYEDTDMGGVVYYANYLKFIERARSEIVVELGVDQNAMKADGLVFVVTRVVADYLAPARLGDQLTVVTTHEAPSPARWVFQQSVERDGTPLFKAEVTAVCMSVAGRPVRLPAELRARLA